MQTRLEAGDVRPKKLATPIRVWNLKREFGAAIDVRFLRKGKLTTETILQNEELWL